MRKSIIAVRHVHANANGPNLPGCCRLQPGVYREAGGSAKRIAPRSDEPKEPYMTSKHRRPLRALAVAAAISALSAPAASAIPAEEILPSARGDSNAREVPVRVVQVGADAGFDWGDAGIGASGLLALIAIGAGAAVATGHRPGPRHSPQPSR
jgi:hypothetical protein